MSEARFWRRVVVYSFLVPLLAAFIGTCVAVLMFQNQTEKVRELASYPTATIAALPACNGSTHGAVYFVTDATSSMDCSTGGGTHIAACACSSGGAWETLTPKPEEPCRRDGNEIICDGPPDEVWFDGIRIK